ncbi:MAG: glutathione S-transferase [Arenicellales bacterium WSBS_2016_MAG_OTU3]
MSASRLPILYSFRRCPYAMRARMALRYAQIEYEHREVLLNDIPNEMRALSPKATIPVLHLADEDRVIDESRDVMYWALAQNDPDNWLNIAPDATVELINHNDQSFKPILDKYKYFVRFPERTQVEYRDEAQPFFSDLEGRLSGNNGKSLTSNKPCLADIALFPFIRQFVGVDRNWFLNINNPLLIDWFKRLEQTPLFLNIMQKHAVWDSHDKKVIVDNKA